MTPRLSTFLFLCALSFLAHGNTVIAYNTRPNIVLIMVDDMGFEALESYGGSSFKTPHLNRLAAEGVQFNQCHSTPLCTPSRVRIMTGQYSYRNFEKFAYLNPEQTTFADVAKSAGYATAVAGKWQLSVNKGDKVKDPTAYGFDDYFVWYLEGRTGSRFADPVLSRPGSKEKLYQGAYGPDLMSDFLCDFIEANQDGSFFAYYPMVLTHYPFEPTPDSNYDLYKKDNHEINPKGVGGPSFNWDTVKASDFQQEMFGDMVEYTDKIVGKIVEKLESLNLLENTLILFTSDNGSHPSLRSTLNGNSEQGGKAFKHEFGTHVPLIAYWKGQHKGGQVVDDLIDFMDFFPTVAEAIGADLPASYPKDGVSFVPQIKGQTGEPRSHLFLHYDPGKGKPGNIAYSPLTRFVRTHKYKLYHDGRLYDLRQDIREENPLPADSLPEKRQQLQAYLDAQPPIEEAVTPSVNPGSKKKKRKKKSKKS